MPITADIIKNKAITELTNGINTALKTIMPIKYQLAAPKLLGTSLNLHFGVLVGLTGDVQTRLVMAGNPAIFSSIAQTMYGMTLEGDMLTSFSSELGNMLAGTLSTQIETIGVKTAITAPTIMEGNMNLSGYEKALNIPVDLENHGKIDIYLLID